MAELKLLALDLGAESGRAVVGHLDGRALRLEEMHRFPNGPVRVNGHLHWDALRLYSEIVHGIGLAVSRQVDGISHFVWQAMLPKGYWTDSKDPEVTRHADGFRRMHDGLEKIGDVLRTVRRDRAGEVAVLYSLYNFAPDLLPPPPGDGESAYTAAFHAAYTGYVAINSLLRAGIQAGWLCEEEILERDGLAGRAAIILPDGS